MPRATTAERVIAAEVGTDTPAGTVQGACSENRGQWYCTTHETAFRNQLEKDFHIHQGKHVLAWACFEHGLERP